MLSFLGWWESSNLPLLFLVKLDHGFDCHRNEWDITSKWFHYTLWREGGLFLHQYEILVQRTCDCLGTATKQTCRPYRSPSGSSHGEGIFSIGYKHQSKWLQTWDEVANHQSKDSASARCSEGVARSRIRTCRSRTLIPMVFSFLDAVWCYLLNFNLLVFDCDHVPLLLKWLDQI